MFEVAAPLLFVPATPLDWVTNQAIAIKRGKRYEKRGEKSRPTECPVRINDSFGFELKKV